MWKILPVLLPLLLLTECVDRGKFKSCQQSGFCQRCRNVKPGDTPYTLLPDTLHSSPTGVEALLINNRNSVKFKLELTGLADNTFRLKINEAYPLKPRFEVPLVLTGEPEQVQVTVLAKDDKTISIGLENSPDYTAVVTYAPFRVDFYHGTEPVMVLNSRGLMKFEHLRNKPGGEPSDSSANNSTTDDSINFEANATETNTTENVEANEVEDTSYEGENMWEESYGGHTDSKPNGPSAIAMDFTFPGMENVYGIPQHADTFSLKDTTSTDPYRLYNLDVFEYELWNPMALYAAIPFMMGHSKERTVGLFWLNAAEGWIDIQKGDSAGILGSLSNMMGGGSSPPPAVNTHWMFESGVMDVFVMLGPGPKDVSRQYGRLTGNTPLPPEFSLGYHQCRWNYNDQEDVNTVNAKFDEHDIPMDVMWLDIEHTDGKKYFTWDGRKFPDSVAMIENLVAHGRKLVTIVDPHIKKDSGYWVHNDLTSRGLYVKNAEGGSDYEGWCWPGASYYPDFLNPEARQYMAEQYKLENYKGSTLDCYTWNDMNEPSVFNGPEVTMAKDKKHGEWEHRDLHNMYGMLYTMATHQGQLLRSENQLRPFILTRSAFAGSQRFAAIWTGDNTADWGHLEASVPMCLSLGVAGMAFCGADIGGFFNNPDGELMTRWYQAAAFQPFFRSHAHIDTKRREPWLFSPAELSIIRQAVRTRYSFLPFWYTLFYETEVTGVPAMRPLWYEFPRDEVSFSREGSHMLGEALLVAPVLHKSATQVNVYFPGSTEFWYDIWSQERVHGAQGEVTVDAPYNKVPVFQRGGTIIPRRERVRRSSVLMHEDPITLYIALDPTGKARGTLYLDDGKSHQYKEAGQHIYTRFNYDNGKLESTILHSGMETGVWLEKIVIMGTTASSGPAKVISKDGEKYVETVFDLKTKVKTVRKPGVNLGTSWTILIQ